MTDQAATEPADQVAPAATALRGRKPLLYAGAGIVVALLLWLGFAWIQEPDETVIPAPPIAAPIASEDGRNADPALLRRIDDAARVNRALREQVLGLTQRVGLLEDGIAGIERGAAPGMDALRLAEADFLLQLAEQRLRLYADVAAAQTALQLADAQLAEAVDPGATSVRQTLALERDALAAAMPPDLPILLARLDAMAASAGHWRLQLQQDNALTGADAPGWIRRTGRVLDRYFRVRRSDPAEVSVGGPWLRERLALDLSRGRLLLLRGEYSAAKSALESVRATLAESYDSSEPAVAQALQTLDDALSQGWTQPSPQLGEARRELARLRGVRMRDLAPGLDSNADAPAEPDADPEPTPAPTAVERDPPDPDADGG